MDVLYGMVDEKEMKDKEKDERIRMILYVEVLAHAKMGGRNPYRLDQQEVQSLETLVGNHYDRPAIWASNLLCAQYRICRPPYTGGVPAPKSLNQPKQPRAVAEYAPALRIHPNPASHWAAFSYHIPGHRAILQLRIRDAQGRVVHTLQAAGEEGQVVWDPRRVAPGLYTVELLRDGHVERTERLVIQP